MREATARGGSPERPFSAKGVRGVLVSPRLPSGDALILTHGAGSDRDAPLLKAVAQAFASAGWLVLRYDLPFRQERPKGPPVPSRAARDREGIKQAAEAIRGIGVSRVCAGGHSYGGRQSAMLAAENPDLFAGLLLLSYPLHPPGKPDQVRSGFFPQLRTPGLFVHGDRDPFGSLGELRDALKLIPAPIEFIPVAGSGHDLQPIVQEPAPIVTSFCRFVAASA